MTVASPSMRSSVLATLLPIMAAVLAAFLTIGLALPGSAGAPAPYETRDQYAEASGKQIVELIKLWICPRDSGTR